MLREASHANVLLIRDLLAYSGKDGKAAVLGKGA